MYKLLFTLIFGLASAVCAVAQIHAVSAQPLRCATCQAPLPRFIATNEPLVRATPQPLEESSPAYVVDVLIVYDRTGHEVAQREGGVAQHAQRVIALSNSVFANSGIDARLHLAGTLVLEEAMSSISDALGFGLSSAPIAQKRRDTRADIVVLCSEPVNDGHSGIALLEANASSALASVRASAAVHSYTAAHEIGHIFGCEHSRESIDAGQHPYAVGASRAPYYTVMGFPEQDGLTEQAPLFSGPQSVWKGVVMGSATEDCVRKIRERLPQVSAFDQAASYQLSLAAWDIDHTAQSTSVSLDTETFYFIKTSAPWLTTSIANGYGATAFTLSAEANPTAATRTATLTVEGNEEYAPATLIVTQMGRTTAVEAATAATSAASWQAGAVHVALPYAAHVTIYDTGGLLLHRAAYTAGQYAIPLTATDVLVVKISVGQDISQHVLLAR